MADRLYARERMGVAVWMLATGPGRIRERLSKAAVEVYRIGDAMPPEHQSEYQSIRSVLTGHQTVEATVTLMDERQAVEVAKRICELDSRISME